MILISLCFILSQSSTIGLVTLNEMKAKQEDVVKEREKELARKQKEQEKLQNKELAAKKAKKELQKQQVCSILVLFCMCILVFDAKILLSHHVSLYFI